VWYPRCAIYWQTCYADDLKHVPLRRCLRKNVTLGAPRLEEIINVATTIKTPSLTVYLQPELSVSAELAKNVQQELAFTFLRTVTAAVEIWYDPDHLPIARRCHHRA